MIKGVLIYDRKSGLSIYSSDPLGSVSASSASLASFTHMIRSIERSSNQEIKKKLVNVKFHQFLVTLDECLKITDTSSQHNNIQFHDYCDYSGVFSVTNERPENVYQILKRMVEGLEVNKSGLIIINDDLRTNMSNILKEYLIPLNVYN